MKGKGGGGGKRMDLDQEPRLRWNKAMELTIHKQTRIWSLGFGQDSWYCKGRSEGLNVSVQQQVDILVCWVEGPFFFQSKTAWI